jgi:hypothetical protein
VSSYTECHVQALQAECRYAECRYAECLSAISGGYLLETEAQLEIKLAIVPFSKQFVLFVTYKWTQ